MSIIALNNPTYIEVPTVDSMNNDFSSDVIGNKSDTILGTSLVSLIKQIIDSLTVFENEVASSTQDEATGLDAYAGTATSGETGADIVTIPVTTDMKKIYSLLVDITNFTTTALVTLRLYTSINGNEKKIYSQVFRKGQVPNGVWVITGVTAISSDLRLEVQSTRSADTSVDVGYEYIEEELK